jgi:Ca-activated chloride channel family protein
VNEVIQLSRPLILLGLLLLPLYGLLRARLLRRDAVPHAPLQYRPPARRRLAEVLRWAVELLLLAAAVIALAGPHRTTRLELMEDAGVDVMLVLDVSLSMLAEDFPPNRLEALRRIARDFIARSGSNRLGVLVFAKDVFVQTPLTTDHGILTELLESVTVYLIDQAKSGGTAVGDAILVAAERLAKAKVEGRDQALVLITDGESNVGIEPELAARYAASSGVRLYAIGIGGEKPVEVFFEGERVGGDDPYLAYLDDRELKAVAAAAGGRYFRAADVGALEQVFAQLSRLESAPLEVRTVEIRHFQTSSLALAAFPLFAACLVLGGAVLRRPFR